MSSLTEKKSAWEGKTVTKVLARSPERQEKLQNQFGHSGRSAVCAGCRLPGSRRNLPAHIRVSG